MGVTEEELNELHRHRALLEHVDELISVIDLSGHFTYVSPSLEEFIGHDSTELVGADCFDGIHPDDVDAVRESFAEVAVAPGRDLTVEYRHRTADGAWRWLRTTGTNHVETPHVGGVLAVSRDITDRREHLDQLEVYETIVDFLPSAVMIKDSDGRYELANPQVYAELDADEEELLGSTDRELFGPKIGEDIWSRERAAVEGKDGPVTYEEVVEIADESRVYLSTRVPMRDEDGTLNRVLGISRNVTERRTREEQLEAYQSRLETAMDNAHFAWWEMDIESGSVSFGEQKAEFLKADPADFSHYEDFTERVHPDDYEPMMQAMRDHMEGRVDRYETKYRIRRGDDEYIWFHDVGQITHTEEGVPKTVIGITLDITTQRKYEQRLAALNVALADLLAVDTKAAATEALSDIVSETLPDLWATIALASESGDRLDQLFMTDSRETVEPTSGVRTDSFDEGLWISKVFRRHEAAEIDDYCELEASERTNQDLPFRRSRAVPLGRHGLFVLASPSTDPFEQSVLDFVDVLVQVAEAVYDRLERERELRGAKVSLENRQKRLDAIIQNAPIILFAFDDSGNFTQSTGRGLELLGLEDGEIVGENVFDLYAESEHILTMCRTALDGEPVAGESYVGELSFLNWFTPTFASDGDLEEVLGVAVDITPQVRQERRLATLSDATNELMYARSTDAVGTEVIKIAEEHLPGSPAVMWVWSDEMKTLLPVAYTQAAANMAAAHMDSPQIRSLDSGTWGREVFNTGDETAIDDYLSLPNPSHPGVPLGAVVAFPLSDHALLVASSPDDPFEEPDMEFLRVLANTAEASLDRAAREEALESYKNELERSNENLQEFAYIASHDLQEPLRMVSSYLSLLAHEYEGELGDEADEYIHFAVDGAERMKSMIEALLTYSRVHTRAQPFDEVDLDVVLDDVVQSLLLVIEESNATVTRDSLPAVDCDGDQLGQVFQNLLANAVEHAGDDPPEVHVGVTEYDDEYLFSVADNGTGIAAGEQRHIFEIFKRGERGTSDDGTGIGLAICERIVERHGGDIWVESAEGEGATFYFTVSKVSRPNSDIATSMEQPGEDI